MSHLRWLLRAFGTSVIGYVPILLLFGWGGLAYQASLDAFLLGVLLGLQLYFCPAAAVVLWPLSYFLGKLILGSFAFIGDRERRRSIIGNPMQLFVSTDSVANETLRSARIAMSRQAALEDFLRQAFARGETPASVLQLLLRNGWSEDDVHHALTELEAHR